MVFTKTNGIPFLYDEKFAVTIELQHNDFDFEYDAGVANNTGYVTNGFAFEMNPHEQGVVTFDHECWRILPKRYDGSSLGSDALEIGKEIDAMVVMYYDDGQGTRGKQMGTSKSFKFVVRPGGPSNMKIIIPNNKKSNKTITIMNGSSLNGTG